MASIIIKLTKKMLTFIKTISCFCSVYVKNIRMKYKGNIFSDPKLKPLFFLPLYKSDLIQSRIYGTKQYFEFDNLNFVCNIWRNGIVGKRLYGGTIVDVGANIGNHTLYFFFECNISKALCFEPINSTFKILRKNIQINNLEDKVTLHNLALGSHNGYGAVKHFNSINIGETSIEEVEGGQIPIISFDACCNEEVISLVKIDVEGFELEVVKGMMDNIQRHKPFIMIEIRDSHFTELESILVDVGYKFTVVKDYSQFGYKDYLFYPILVD